MNGLMSQNKNMEDAQMLSRELIILIAKKYS